VANDTFDFLHEPSEDGAPMTEETEGAPRQSSAKLPRPAVLGAAVATVAALVFAPAIGGRWIYDDHPLIQNNGWVHGFHAWTRWFTTDFWDVNEEVKRFSIRMIYWRPAVSASYALDWKLGGGEPALFHMTNLVWHGLGAFLCFVALRRWLGAVVPAALAALLFAIHPTKAESVAWIAGRTDVLCLVAMLVAMEGVARRLRGERHGLPLEVLGTALAYMVKEQAVVLPALVAVEAWVALGRPPIGRSIFTRVARTTAPQLAIAVVYLLVRMKWMPVRAPSKIAVGSGPYFAQLFETMGRYLVLALAPHDLSMQQGLFHSDASGLLFDRRYIVVGVIGIVGLLAAAFVMRRRNPPFTVGILLFFVLILPTSNIVSTGMVTMLAERFLYLPTIGLALSAGALLQKAGRFTRPANYVALGIAAIFAVVAVRRARDFGDERRFWAREARLHPDSLEAIRFAASRATEKKQYRRALELASLGQSIAARSFQHTGDEFDFTIQGLGLLVRLIPDNDRDSLNAIAGFFEAVIEPTSPTARLATRDVVIEVPLSRSVILSRARATRPRLQIQRAELASRLGDDALAVRFAEAAVATCVGCAEIGHVAALVEGRAGRYREAFAVLDTVGALAGKESVAATQAMLQKAELAGRMSAMSDEGPVKLKLRADELSTLEAWGRAYAVLSPHKEQIKLAPGFAFGFAELALRAGEPAVAREVLSVVLPPEKIDPMLAEWTAKMGWSDPKKP